MKVGVTWKVSSTFVNWIRVHTSPPSGSTVLSQRACNNTVIPFRIHPLVGKRGAAAGLIHTTICLKDTEQQMQRYETVRLSWV